MAMDLEVGMEAIEDVAVSTTIGEEAAADTVIALEAFRAVTPSR